MSITIVNKNKKIGDRYAFIAVILFLIYSFYYSLLSGRNFIQLIIVGGSIFFGILSVIFTNNRFNIQNKFLMFMSGWLLIIVLFLFFRNWWDVTTTIKRFWAFFIVFCVCKNFNRLTGIYKAIIIIGFPHVIATFFFYIFPNLYPIMYKVFGKWVGGTRNGKYGYRAGISNHYSLNALYITIVFLCCFAYTITLYKKHNKKYILSGLITLLVFLALFLTMKRAHLLFSLTAIILGMLFFTRNISAKKILIFFVILLILCGIFLWAYQNIPEIKMTLQRFENLDEDGNLKARFGYWNTALQIFLKHPIIGIGWGGVGANTVYEMNAHNVYIQLLAETGIIGFTIYMFTITTLGIKLIRGCRINIKKTCYDELYFSSFAALLIYFFYILYSLSGNCFFDHTFNFFIFTIITTYYLTQPKVRKSTINVYCNFSDNELLQSLKLSI